MKIELFTVSDFAADYGGKLSIIGVFDTIMAHEAPITHSTLSIGVKVRFEKIEEGKKNVRLFIADADGKTVLAPLEVTVSADTPQDHHSGTFVLVVNIGGVKFEKFGEYSIDLAINGRHEGRIPLYLRQTA